MLLMAYRHQTIELFKGYPQYKFKLIEFKQAAHVYKFYILKLSYS